MQFKKFLSYCLLTFSALTSQAFAQDIDNWPERELRLIVPFGPGSNPDQIARIIAQDLSPILGQSVVVENKAGAGGNIGTAAIAKAKPDGYTFGISINGPLVYNQFIVKNLGFTPDTDLSPLTLAVTQPNIVVVSKDLGVKTLGELIEKLKANPDQYNFATVGIGSGSHLSSELLLKATGTQAVSVPYNGSPNAINSLLSGDTHFSTLSPAAVMGLVNDGRLIALAQTLDERSPLLPNIPTVKETGLASITSEAWNGFVISSKVPTAIQDKLQKALYQVVSQDSFAQKVKAQYMQAMPTSAEGFQQFMQEEKARWQPIIEQLNLQQ